MSRSLKHADADSSARVFDVAAGTVLTRAGEPGDDAMKAVEISIGSGQGPA
jgi:CRP-like cAMP-binding protein